MLHFFFLNKLFNQIKGLPINSKQEVETQVNSTKQSKLTNEWLNAKERISYRISVTMLPYSERFHELPSCNFYSSNDTSEDQSTVSF